MDDILIYTDGSKNDHWEKVRDVLKKLQKAGLYLDRNKCEFLSKKVKYLGFIIIAGESFTADPEKIKAILDWQPPTTVKGVRSFIGFANFYRCFVDKFSEIASPLINLTKKGVAWKWGSDESNSFESLKKIFSPQPVLAQ